MTPHIDHSAARRVDGLADRIDDRALQLTAFDDSAPLRR